MRTIKQHFSIFMSCDPNWATGFVLQHQESDVSIGMKET